MSTLTGRFIPFGEINTPAWSKNCMLVFNALHDNCLKDFTLFWWAISRSSEDFTDYPMGKRAKADGRPLP